MYIRGVWLLILTLVFEQTSKITCFVSTPSIFLCFQTYNKQPRNETKKWLVTTANNLLSLTLLLPCWDALNSNQRFPLPQFFKVTNITSSFLRSSLQHKTQKKDGVFQGFPRCRFSTIAFLRQSFWNGLMGSTYLIRQTWKTFSRSSSLLFDGISCSKAAAS